MPRPRLLNIGCGSHFHKDWINLDVAPADPAVTRIDITRGLPFPAQFADVCYSSHVLEHMNRAGAQNFIRECFRVLKTDGVMRVVVPDLEAIAREYLGVLQSVAAGDATRESDYEWLMLELYDQTVRETAGGEMSKFLTGLDPANRSFVRSRIGMEAEGFWSGQEAPAVHKRWRKLLRNWRSLSFRARVKVVGWIVHLIAGADAHKSYDVGVFRSSGEIHQWMYDRFSLKRLLDHAGFEQVRICTAGESRIPEFAKYYLDLTNGAARKPDSLYVEASKP